MPNKYTNQVNWSEVDPDLAEMIYLDNQFLEAAKLVYASGEDSVLLAERAELARQALARRDRVDVNSIADESLVAELGSAYLFLSDDNNHAKEYINIILEVLN